MIPEFAITEWSTLVPWREKEQVEQMNSLPNLPAVNADSAASTVTPLRRSTPQRVNVGPLSMHYRSIYGSDHPAARCSRLRI